MLVSLSWLKEYVDTDLGADEIAEALTMAGLETVNLGSPVPDIEGVVTARIEKIGRHPDADKLTVCKVRPADDAEPLTIVCGAPNISEGDIVPLAKNGTKLPGGTKLKRSKIRGVESNGMMCSLRELGMGEDHSGIWILPEGTPLGKPLPEALGEDDAILEPEPTPNRGDLHCVLGIARELASITGAEIKPPSFDLAEEGPDCGELSRVDIEDYEGCPRYVARIIQGVKIGPSPPWLVKRLESAGMRSINNVVDVTNFVMLELGQPLHAFDFNTLRGKRIVVNTASEGDKFTTLDGQERTLHSDTLMIRDGEGPVAIAGVMGGLDSEVSENTADILLESAYFKPTSVRRTARLLGIPSEASRRFDKGVDPLGTVFAADRAIALINELAGGKVAKGYIDANNGLPERAPIRLRPERTNFVLGSDFSPEDQERVLASLPGAEVEMAGNAIEVLAPSYRPDLLEEHDLIEEVARLKGFDAIETTMPMYRMGPMPVNAARELNGRMRTALKALGFSEAVLTNFEDPERLAKLGLAGGDYRLRSVELKNPLAANESVMRTTLLPKLLDCLAMNRNRGITGRISLYELGAVFENTGEELPGQRRMMAGVLSTPVEKALWEEESGEDGFYLLRNAVEQLLALVGSPAARIEAHDSPDPFLHPGRAARVMAGRSACGSFGQIHPAVAEAFDIRRENFIFELNFDMLYEFAGHVPKGRPFSKFPPSLRDIAILVDESVTMGDVIKTVNKMKSPIIESVALFDVFRGGALGEGKKSLAFHVRYQSLDRTLKDKEVAGEHDRLAAELVKKLGASIR